MVYIGKFLVGFNTGCNFISKSIPGRCQELDCGWAKFSKASARRDTQDSAKDRLPYAAQW